MRSTDVNDKAIRSTLHKHAKIVLGFVAIVNCLPQIWCGAPGCILPAVLGLPPRPQAAAPIPLRLALGDFRKPFFVQNDNPLAPDIDQPLCLQIIEHLGRRFAIGPHAFG